VDVASAYFAIAGTFKKRNNSELAIEYYLKSIDIHPKARALASLAEVLQNEHRDSEALSYIERAIDIDEEESDYHYIKAVSLMQLGNFKEAIQYFKNTLKYFPHDKAAERLLKECEILAKSQQ